MSGELVQIDHFCVLIVGDPGYLGRLSILSIFECSPSRVCALVDDLGNSWIDKLEHDFPVNVCRHLISEKHSWVLANFDSKLDYEIFGSSKFFRLMFLKWIVLQECMQEDHKGNYLIFSDLDVLWIKNLNSCLSDFANSPARFALQDDSSTLRQFFCPGIMIWKTSPAAKRTLSEIQNYHYKALMENPHLPDDKAINRWLLEGSNMGSMFVLPNREFVIGHRIYQLLLESSGFKLSKLVAFHANYSIGSSEKILKIQAVRKSLRINTLKYLQFGKLVTREIFRRWVS